MFDWDRSVNTSTPEYYKWTQWLFLQLYKAGLAYRAVAPVNWCPSCKTVLADEQVIQGKCERCDSEVLQKETEQWFFKITQYAEELLKDLENIDWSERTKIAQRNWIGKSEGAEIIFPVVDSKETISVFTTRPDTLFGSTYMVLAPDHALVDTLKEGIQNWGEIEQYRKEVEKKSELERTDLAKEKTGVKLEGVEVVNPANQEKIPVFIADYVLSGYGTGAIMAVPAHDERDFEFATTFSLPIIPVVDPGEGKDSREDIIAGKEVYIGDGVVMNSGEFDGLSVEEGKKAITKHVKGEKKITYHLRDWLISRQRYWGPPIPMIHCEKCGVVPVPEEDLPVLLPGVEDFRPTGTDDSPLAAVKEFVNVKCPECRGEARRETDVSDTFLDSAWYFLRYPSVEQDKVAFEKETTKKWLPVNMYIGGQEHAVLHLLYTRFVTKALKDEKLIDFAEPFDVFRAHGLLIRDGAKMSKSKGNVINPDEYIEQYGADVVRTYLMFLAPLSDGGDWSDRGIIGISRFLSRLWNFVENWKEEGTEET
ncbi:MAG: leucine--tRNA ligase, partial [archaeon]|nr:leucine--tRNA ligase [archaeon]